MGVNSFAIVLLAVVAACLLEGGEAASLSKIDCTKCRLDVYSFGSKDYDCGIARHNKLPICAVECKIHFEMNIPIPNLTLDFDPKACVPSTPPTAAPSTPPAAPSTSSSTPSAATRASATAATTTTTVTAETSAKA